MNNRISRRNLLLGGSTLAAARAAAPARPNILWLMADEYRHDAIHCAGHPMVSTPNLDRIAREGMRFATTYTVSPVCSPSRASAFSGRYAHVHGVTTNQYPANNGEIFLPSMLRHYGYHTAISGKLHFVPQALSISASTNSIASAPKAPRRRRAIRPSCRRSTDRRRSSPSWPAPVPGPNDELGRDVGVFKHEPQDFETEWIADRSLDFLRSRKGNAQPWFLYTSFLRPHSPSVLPKKYFDMYDPDKVPIFKLPPDAHALREQARGRQKRHLIDDERMERVITSKYFGAITNVDDNIGRIFAELERLGMMDNTLILFSADHGNMLGEKAHWFKGVEYEGSAHIPLLWRGPKGAQENTGRVEIEGDREHRPDADPSRLHRRARFPKVCRGAASSNWRAAAIRNGRTAASRICVTECCARPSGSLSPTGRRQRFRVVRYAARPARREESGGRGQPSRPGGRYE